MNRELKISEILEYYDEPQVFLALDKAGGKYLCLLTALETETYSYLGTRISDFRLGSYFGGIIDLRKILKEPEISEWVRFSTVTDDYFYVETSTNAPEEEELPDAGFYPFFELDSDKDNERNPLALQVQSIDGLHFIEAEVVAKVVGDVVKSYKNYLSASFLNDKRFTDIRLKNPKYIELLQKDLALYVTHTEIGSFLNEMTPMSNNTQLTLFSSEVEEWKKIQFVTFKNEVVKGDFSNPDYISKISDRFSPDQRREIFAPIFRAASENTNYRLNIYNRSSKRVVRTIRTPIKEFKEILAPPKPKKETIERQIVQAFIEVETNNSDEGLTLNSKTVKKIFSFEKLEYETYPFATQSISFNGVTYLLQDRIKAEVSYEEEMYFISYEPLGIEVWGESREKTEDAFGFQFYAMVQNYYYEKDENLSPKAIELRNSLQALIKQIISDENT